jgi:hypothetical protein
MAVLVQLSGLPGTGKTTSAETLDPKKTFIVDADKKGLSWAGWRKNYNQDNKNYVATSDLTKIVPLLLHISKNRPEVEVVIIDTQNSITSDIVMMDMKKPDYNQWKELAADIYELQDVIRSNMRDDMVVYITAHVEPYTLNGLTYWRTKFDGQKLTKLNMNGKLNYNLYTHVEGENQDRKYFFITQNNGFTEARSTKGALPYKIESNLRSVTGLIQEAEGIKGSYTQQKESK